MHIIDMPAEAEIRRKRQDAILAIIQARSVTSQTQLAALLRARGLDATQSSVSRDLKALGVIKLDAGYAPADNASRATERELSLLGEFVREIDTAGANLTVVKTAIGAAQRVAVYLDRTDWPEIVGTLSGDDSIFIATRNASAQRRLVAKLRAQLNN
ncbi:MAG: arginine repressor [Gammaproteobacteria bacterium]|nr:MAG: arginine repressor [Gammaproteobacteria bacterium]